MLKKLIFYQTRNGKTPFTRWLDSIRDQKTTQRIEARLDRVALGNLGDHKGVGEGVQELRMSFGPGYRVYYGEDGDTIVVLLRGGDKSTQSKDIREAQIYWKDYLRRKES